MKIGEIIEVEGVKYIAQEEILACKGCYFEYPDNADCYDKFGCKSEDKVIFVKIPVELIEKIEQLEKQIELMKNCDNCNNSILEGDYYCCERYIGCVGTSKWEMKK